VTHGGSRLRVTVLVGLVGLVALAARLGPVLTGGTLRAAQGYDDGVHLAVAQRLLAGVLPYRDEVFLHPPGIAVLLSPFAALAGPLGDSWSLGLARIAFMLLGSVNAMLVAWILARRGILASAVGGGAYALWGASLAAEHTVYLEGPIAFGLLLAVAALHQAGPGSAARSRAVTRAVAVSGLALGVAATFKIWVAIDVVVLAALVVSRWGPRTLVRWFGWCALGAAPILVPFLALAPGQLWHDVVVVQSARPTQGKALPSRFAALDPTATWHAPLTWQVVLALGLVLVAVLLLPLVRALYRRVPLALWSDPLWWGVLAAAQLLALAVAPSFYLHYAAFAAPALCLVLGAATGRFGARARRARPAGGAWVQRGPAAIVALALVGAVVLAVNPPPMPDAGPVDNVALAAFAAGHACVWSRNPSYLQVADASARQIRAGCPSSPDLLGVWLTLSGGGRVPGSSATTLDSLVLEQLRGSDAAILAEQRPMQDLGPRARSYFHENFERVRTIDGLELWSRRG